MPVAMHAAWLHQSRPGRTATLAPQYFSCFVTEAPWRSTLETPAIAQGRSLFPRLSGLLYAAAGAAEHGGGSRAQFSQGSPWGFSLASSPPMRRH